MAAMTRSAPSRLATTAAALAALTVGVWAPSASAHTEADYVAVPAGAEATLTLRPTHGCGDSPTVAVAIQAPVEGATAGDVEGWAATATPDGRGNTVLEWTGGSLPADQAGAFPISFSTPDNAGRLLVFPSVQECENGETLSWIDGDPASEDPVPRLLILPVGSSSARSIEDVPPDAPGRDQLTAVIEIGEPASTTTTTTTPEGSDLTTTSAATGSSTTSATEDGSADGTSADAIGASGSESTSAEDDGSSSTTLIVVIGVVVVAGIGGLVLQLRRRSHQ
jgi:uncharacterized protein YcnI